MMGKLIDEKGEMIRLEDSVQLQKLLSKYTDQSKKIG